MPDTNPTTLPETTLAPETEAEQAMPTETPARPRLDPTRYGDWELNGKCVDF